MVCQIEKHQHQAIRIPKAKASLVNLQEVPQQHPIIRDQGKGLQITIGQKNLTHEGVP